MSRVQAAIVPVTPLQQNCALLWSGSRRAAWVIDPGGDVARILAAISELELTVERIVLTHGHVDHAGGAAALRQALAVPIDGPDRRDAFLLDDLEQQGARFGIDDASNVRPDRFLTEGDELSLNGSVFRVLHCPGHTPGHIALSSPGDLLAIVGDVLFAGSVGRTDFSYGDGPALLASIRDKLLPLGDETSFLCGHGPGSTIGAERRANPFVQQALRSTAASA